METAIVVLAILMVLRTLLDSGNSTQSSQLPVVIAGAQGTHPPAGATGTLALITIVLVILVMTRL